MAPVPMRGKRNEPAYVAFIGKEICQLKGITENDFKQQLNQNYQSLFLSKV
ncbi:hypothetical protein SDC9_146022 [bioreactor metagenome]|uniref:Uncharacterized protein n=1 Tax=bioreactor metagenome TaxID=1076179 RepID=A0A645EE09_9ZZZZ